MNINEDKWFNDNVFLFGSTILFIQLKARSYSDEEISIVLTTVIKGFKSEINEWSFFLKVHVNHELMILYY